MADGSTTKAKMRLEHLSWAGELRRDALGRLCTVSVPGAKALDASKAQLLLGGPTT